MTKFSPDFILFHDDTRTLFMLDAKVSITPMYFDSAISSLRTTSKRLSLDRHCIGEIEREAYDNYTNRYPRKKVAICLAAPYSPGLIHADWASETKALHRFEADVNEAADGSGTPHVNVDISGMRTLDQFLKDELGIDVDKDMYKDVLDEIKRWPLNKPGRVNWTQFNNAIVQMSGKCPWLKGRIPDDHSRMTHYVTHFKKLGLELEVYKSTKVTASSQASKLSKPAKPVRR